MKSFKSGRVLSEWVRGAGWFVLTLCLGLLAWGADGVSQPEIRSIERRGDDLMVRVSVPAGVARVVLEGCQRGDFKAWVPKGVARVTPGESEAIFSIRADAGLEMFRVRADATEPLPASFYAGVTNFVGTPSSDPSLFRNVNAPGIEDSAAGGGAAPVARDVVESDIWVVRGDTLYFFNQYRGLQIIDIQNPDAPAIRGTFSLPGAGEQMYLLEDRYAVLLAHDPCQQWGTDAESAVVIVDTTANPPAELARLPMKGRIVESRLVGTALYVATETWAPSADASGAWQSGTVMAGFDLADPRAPRAQPTLWRPGSGNVVTATDRFLFVSVIDYSRNWPWKSELEVVDISAPDGTLVPFARIPLAGHVADKFKIDLLDDVLRVVVESLETETNGRWITVLETIRLSDPRAASPVAYARLDRLELARGERLFATRFDGTRGYFVTFLRVDPLWVIDLSDPADLKIAGELEIPGWSTFIRPMGDRLLTLGVDNARGWRVAVQLFDVSDPARPALLAKVPLGEDSSWSEANNDEKAFGIFPDAGLLLVPVSEWNGGSGKHGVQLLDFGRETLKARGFLESDAVVPRRAAFQADRVFTVSGRQMVTASVSDRDQPKVTATVELAYPVERVVLAGSHLIEFQSGGVRVRPGVGGDAVPTEIALGDLSVLGATMRGTRLHVLQGKAAEVQWDYVKEQDTWVGRTNAGVLYASVWDASALPALTKVGEAKAPTLRTWLGDAAPVWAGDELLVWAGVATQSYWRGGWFGPAVDVAMPIGGRGLWMPWWWGGPRDLTAVKISGADTPEIVSQVQAGENGQGVGEVRAAGSLLFSTRLINESKVVGTNTVIEQAWFPRETTLVTNVIELPDGSTTIRVTEKTDGEWRPVTNSYPVYQWWARHELDVFDYGPDPAQPLQRPAVSVPGALLGLSPDGSIVYTTANRAPDEKSGELGWLEASAYDGVALHLVDSVAVADFSAGESYAAAFAGGLAYVARGGWATNKTQRVEVWSLGNDGRWQKGAAVALSAAPSEVRVFNDLLFARSGGITDLYGLATPATPVPLPVTPPPGCFGGDLTRADGDIARGLWLPLWDYGAVRVGP